MPSRTHSLTPPQVLQEIVENGIKIYSFPDTEGDEEEAVANRKLRVSPSNLHVSLLHTVPRGTKVHY